MYLRRGINGECPEPAFPDVAVERGPHRILGQCHSFVPAHHAVERQQALLAGDLADVRVIDDDQVVLLRQRLHGKRLEIL